MATTAYEAASLYSVGAVSTPTDRDPSPFPPGTALTASIETVDNDRACLMLDAGVVR